MHRNLAPDGDPFAQFTNPCLCGDGNFYEHTTVAGTQLADRRLVHCKDFQQAEVDDWLDLAVLAPGLFPAVNDDVLAPFVEAWLALARPTRDSMAQPGAAAPALPTRDDLFPYCLRTLGDTGNPLVVQATLRRLPGLALTAWAPLAEAMLAADSPRQRRHPQEVDALAGNLARALRLDDAMGPRGDLHVRTQALEQLDANDLPDNEVSETLRLITDLIAARPSAGGRDDGYAAKWLAGTLAAVSHEERRPLLAAVSEIYGPVASARDCATGASLLATVSPQRRPTLVRMLRSSNHARSVRCLHEVFEALSNRPVEDINTLLGSAMDLADNYGGGDLIAFKAFLEAMAPPEIANHRVTCERFESLFGRQFDFRPQTAWSAFTALSNLAADNQQILVDEAGEVRAQVRDRRLDLGNLEALQRFCQDHPGTAAQVERRRIATAPVESVMDAGRTNAMLADVETLRRRFGNVLLTDTTNTITELRKYLNSAPAAPLRQQARAGSNEHANALHALRVIESCRHIPASSGRLANHQILALVYAAIEQHDREDSPERNAKARAIMLFGLARGLAQCIEERGNMVCYWGQGQRLLAPLYGQGLSLPGEALLTTPTPAELLTSFSETFYQQLARAGRADDPTPQDIAGFFADLRRLSETTYGARDPRVAETIREARRYAEVSDWPTPAA